MARSYTSPTREAAAARTRARIVDAAGDLFSRDGWTATTLKAVAEHAGVSVQSVHLAGPKASLLIAAFERSFAGDEGPHSLAERPEMAAIMARPDVDDALEGWLDYVAEANRRTAGLSRAMVSAAEGDPLAAAAVADLDARRRRDMQIAAQWAVGRGLLHPAHAEHAADEISWIVGPEAYAHLVDRSDWRFEDYRAWLQRSMLALLGHWRSTLD